MYKMAVDKSPLFEYNENEFNVVLSDSTVTPVFSPFCRSNAQLYFEVCYKRTTSIHNSSVSKKQKVIKSSALKIFLHGDQLTERINIVTTVLYESKSVFKTCEGSLNHNDTIRGCTTLCDVALNISSGDTLTSYGREIPRGKIILRSKFYVGGHLGTAESLFHLKGTLNSRTLFLQHFTDLFESETLSDVTIHVEDKTLQAHKLILSTHSPVFHKMFQNDFLESKTNTIKIVDVTFEVFEFFLKYVYSGALESGFEKYVDELYKLADKYNVEPLKADCVRKMAEKIDMNTICELLPFAYDCNDEEIKSFVKSFAVKNFAQLELKSEWKDFVKSHPYIGFDILAEVYIASKFVPTKKNTC